MRKKLLILYSSRKGGHIYPANALLNYLTENCGTIFISEIINLLDLSLLAEIVEKLGRYGDLKLKRLWRYGYRNLQEENFVFLKTWALIENLLFSLDGLKRKLSLAIGRPDIIISIQPEVNILSPLLKRWFNCPLHTIIIDLAIHGLWVHKLIDHFYVFNENLAYELQNRGVNPYKITISGIPLRANFSKVVEKDMKGIRKKLGIFEELSTVLLLSGLLGEMVDFNEVIRSIIEADLPIQLLVVFGKNEKGKRKLSRFQSGTKIPIFSYGVVNNIAEMMWASDLVITKPGSVTIAESLALGKPMVVITPKAGSAQEMRFARFLKDSKAGEWVDGPEEVGPVVKRILLSKELYQEMQNNAKKIGRHSLTANVTITENLMRRLT